MYLRKAAGGVRAVKLTSQRLEGVAWLWPEPGPALLDWRNRFNRHLNELENDSSRLNSKTSLNTKHKLYLAAR